MYLRPRTIPPGGRRVLCSLEPARCQARHLLAGSLQVDFGAEACMGFWLGPEAGRGAGDGACMGLRIRPHLTGAGLEAGLTSSAA